MPPCTRRRCHNDQRLGFPSDVLTAQSKQTHKNRNAEALRRLKNAKLDAPHHRNHEVPCRMIKVKHKRQIFTRTQRLGQHL